MSNKKILVALTSCERLGDTDRKTGYFLSEVTHPVRVFSDAGLDVTFVSPAGGQPPVDPGSRDHDDPDNRWFLGDESWLRAVEKTSRPADLDPGEYDAIFFAGGHGTMWDFPDDAELAALTAAIWDSGGVVAAVCHGPAALVNVRLEGGDWLVDGRKLTSFTDAEEAAVELTEVVPFLLESRLRERGADFQGAGNFEPNVVTDGRLVTGQNPASARDVGEATVKLLAG